MRFIVKLLLLLAILLGPVSSAQAQEETPPLYFSGQEGAVKTAIDLSKPTYTQDVSTAARIVLNGAIPDAESIAARLRDGAGVLLIMGPDITAQQVATLLGADVILEARDNPVTLKETPQTPAQIQWNTAPQLRERIAILPPADGGLPLIPVITSLEDNEAIITSAQVGQGQLWIFTARLGEENQHLRQWGYFNYLIYLLSVSSTGAEPLSFAAYPASPVPHPNQRIFIYFVLLILLSISLTIFLLVRRYSLAHPEALDTLVRDQQAFNSREAGTDWEQIGFHRPLGGFMFALMTGICLFIPLTVYNDFILPVYILPSSQAMGIYGRVASFFPIIWGLFDMGTSVAHMKFFSQYRVHDPRRAVQYAQFFVWWQALTGAVQVAMVVAVAGTYMPQSVYALYTWAVITHAMIQIPGFYRLFTDAFSGIQRSDYGTILDMGINLVFPMLTQTALVSLMVWWGRNQPVFGPSMGGVLGLGIAAYATELVSFAFGWYLYRRLGYNPRLLMMAHFDRKIAIDSLKFGIFLFLGSLIGGLGTSINVLVIQNRLFNNNEILGNIGLAGSFVFAFTVFQALTGAMMPSISEAVSNGRKVLAQYYATNGYKYGGMVSGYIGAIMLAVADRFIIGSSGQSFERAAVYVIPMLLSGAMSFLTWNADSVMYGSGKTRMITVLSIIDLILGTSLGLLLVDRFQAFGLLAVPFVTVPVRAALSFFLNHRFCFPQRFYFWQSIGAPLSAGVVHFAIVRFVTGFIWQRDELSSIIILVLALIPSYPIYACLYGFLGGWDINTLAVFDRATRLASFMRPFTRLFYHASAFGARFSPLHNRFPITIHGEAMREAESLTAERVSLVKSPTPGD